MVAMVYPASVNVAVAVAMEDGGLITPVLANADKTDIHSLARNWADLVSRARSGSSSLRSTVRHLHPLQPGDVRCGSL